MLRAYAATLALCLVVLPGLAQDSKFETQSPNPYLCRLEELPTSSAFANPPGRIEKHSIVFTETGRAWPAFHFRNLASSPIQALALVIEYKDKAGRTIESVPIAAASEAIAQQFKSPFAVEGVQHLDRAAIQPGSDAVVGGIRDGIRTGSCPTHAVVTYMMIQFQDDTVRILSEPGWQLTAVPRYIPRAPEIVPNWLPTVPVSLTGKIKINSSGRVDDVVFQSPNGDANLLDGLRDFMKQNWSFHPALVDGKPTASELETLFRFPTHASALSDNEARWSPVTLIQMFRRRDLYPDQENGDNFTVTYGGLSEGSTIR